MARILVVEDEREIADLLYHFLTNAGHCVKTAPDGVEGLSLFAQGSFELVLLDIMLPKIDGYGVLEMLRRSSDVPVIFLTALGDEQSQLRGYDLRVDDYVTKPFSMKVLLKKVDAVLRRAATAPDNQPELRHGALALNLDEYKTYVHGQEIDLTRREFELLREILLARGRVLTREILLDRLWDYGFEGDARVVDTHVKNLRRKVGVPCVETIRGVGYRRAE